MKLSSDEILRAWTKFDRGDNLTDEEIQGMLNVSEAAMAYLETRHCDESRITLRKASNDRQRLLEFVYWRKSK